MTMTNTFVDDELEALQFPFYWDSSEEEDIPVKNYFENGYGYQNEYQNGKVKENKKKYKNHHKNAINVIEQQEDHKTTTSSLGEDIQDNNNNEDSQENNCFGNEWPHYVNIAIHNHRNLSHSLPFTRGDSFESSQIFSVDKARYTARSKLMQVFEIFPWFHIPQPSPTHRFRESLAPHKGEFIDNVTAAINYFWSEPFEEEDYSSLRAYYLQHGAPRRSFYSIIDLRSYMEKIRLDRQTKQLQSNLESYSSRLSVVEDKLKELWLKVSSSSSSSSSSSLQVPLPIPVPIPHPIPVEFAFPIKEETPTLPTPTNWSPRSSNNNNNDNNNKKNKRKVDSLSDDLIKVAPKIQRVERVEKILEILTIATDCGAQKEKEKEGQEGQEQRQYLESNLCHEEEGRNGSRNGSEDGDESDGSGLEMPFEYLDEISLDENYNFFF